MGGYTEPGFRRFLARVTACHVVTYTVVGILAYTLFHYQTLFETPALAAFMRPTSSKWVAAGPGLQVFRGVVIAAALYPFRRGFLERQFGWAMLSGLLIGLSVLSASGPAPGSLEGVVYTKLSLAQHLQGLPETVIQNVAFAWLLCGWYQSPRRIWNWIIFGGTGLAILTSLGGVFAPRPESFR